MQLQAEPGKVGKRAKELAATGVGGVFTFEGPHDVFLPLALAAEVPNLQLMTNVAIAIPRSPVQTAHTAWDLQTLSKGRFRLGLGSQIRPHIVRRYGATWDRPAAQMRDQIGAIKAVFASWQNGTPLDYRGEYTELDLMPPLFNPGPNDHGPPPVLLGALGPVMTRTAAECADGLLVMPFHSVEHFESRTLPNVEAGLSRRTVDGPFSLQPQAILAMARNVEAMDAALAGVRGLLGFYGSTPAYRPVLESVGRGELQAELHAAIKRGEWDLLGTLLNDDLVRRLAVVGTPEECATQLDQRFGAVAERVCVYFPGYEPSDDLLRDLVRAAAGAGGDGVAVVEAGTPAEGPPDLRA
ncbi:MAG: class F420-dependent oxidoreductase [Frankiales bacterium]|nr:class F420-dependent oxidoreductase [Frankiales bacterium]